MNYLSDLVNSRGVHAAVLSDGCGPGACRGGEFKNF